MAIFTPRPSEYEYPYFITRDAYDQSLESAINANETVATSAADMAREAAAPVRSARHRLSAFGDSLTDGGDGGVLWPESDSWPSKLQNALGTVKVTNRGFSSATVGEMLLRAGVEVLPLRVPGGAIPSSGAVVAETDMDIGVAPTRVFGIDGSVGPFYKERTQLIHNSRPMIDSNWNFNAGTGGAATRTFGSYLAGRVGNHVAVTWTAPPTGGVKSITLDRKTPVGSVQSGRRYTAHVLVYSSITQEVSLDVGWYAGASFNSQASGEVVNIPAGQWTIVDASAVAPATVNNAVLSLGLRTNPAAGQTVAVAEGMLEMAGEVRRWFGGDSPGAVWAGLENDSPARMLDNVGINVRLSRDSSGGYTINTYGANEAVSVPRAVFFKANTAGGEADTATVWIGRNDITFDTKGVDADVVDHVVGGVQRLVEWLSPRTKNVMIFGVFAQPNEPNGSARHTTVSDINNRLKALYPGKFKSVHEYLRDRALADLGVEPTPEDLTDIANDTVPTSVLAADKGHVSKATAGVIASKFVAPYLRSKGWV